jgi:sigma-E factor negative regulatory protein RseA
MKNSEIIKGSIVADNIKESLSALMDNEISEIELHRLLKHVNEQDLLNSWISYQQTGGVIRNEPVYSANLHLELQRRISAAVDDVSDFEVSAQPRAKSNTYLKPIGSFAIAASLAFVGFIGFNEYSSNNDSGTEEVVEAIESDSTPNVLPDPINDSQGTRLVNNMVLDPLIESDLQELPPEKQRRLREYLLRHDQQYGPQTRVVTYKKQSDQ